MVFSFQTALNQVTRIRKRAARSDAQDGFPEADGSPDAGGRSDAQDGLPEADIFATRGFFPVILIGARATVAAGLGLALSACAASATTETATPPPPPPPPPAEHVPPPVIRAEGKESSVKILSDVGFKTPESVYFDRKRDVYLVSNINGNLLDKDDNGFISKLSPDGELTLKFIDGADEKIELNAPKGLTVAGNTLYVTDIDTVRTFDLATGLPKKTIEVPGATFLNGIATGKDDVVYVSDSGLDASFKSTGTDSLYTIKNGKLKKLLADKALGAPNGLLAAEDGTWVVSFGSGELFFVTNKGKREASQKMPKGQNDGVVITDDGRFLVSSWEASAIFAGKPGEDFSPLISGVESPAGIGYDCRRNRVLIPLFQKDSVVIHTLGTTKK